MERSLRILSVVLCWHGLASGTKTEPVAGADSQVPVTGKSKPVTAAQAKSQGIKATGSKKTTPTTNIKNFDELLKQVNKMYVDRAAVMYPSGDGKITLVMYPASEVKSQICVEDLWSSLKFVSRVYMMTAGSFQIGDSKPRVQYIHLVPESDFISVPPKVFKELMKYSEDQSGDAVPEKPIMVSKQTALKFPSISLQFAETQTIYELTPRSYISCEGEGERPCEVLIRLSMLMNGYWFLGKPFFNNVVSAISMGNIRDPFVHVCPFKLDGEESARLVKYEASDRKVRMPWTPSDYALLAMICVVVATLIFYVFREKLFCCTRRPRIVQATPAETTETQPLINS